MTTTSNTKKLSLINRIFVLPPTIHGQHKSTDKVSQTETINSLEQNKDHTQALESNPDQNSNRHHYEKRRALKYAQEANELLVKGIVPARLLEIAK